MLIYSTFFVYLHMQNNETIQIQDSIDQTIAVELKDGKLVVGQKTTQPCSFDWLEPLGFNSHQKGFVQYFIVLNETKLYAWNAILATQR